MFSFLGKSKQAEAPQQNSGQKMAKAIAQMDDQIDLLSTKEEHIQKQMNECTRQAAALKKANKKKEKIIPLLKRRKMFEKQLGVVTGQKQHLESHKFALQNAQMMSATIETMKAGNLALESTGIDVDQIYDEMDEVMEQQQKVGEIMDVFQQAPAAMEGFDDDELLAEFEDEMDEEDFEANLLGDDADAVADDLSALDLPDAPSNEPAAQEKPKKSDAQAEAELEELQVW